MPLGINDRLVIHGPMSRIEQRAWMRRAQQWIVMGTVYKAKKMLGFGTYGICALWSKGPGRLSADMRANVPNPPRDVVIKQSRHPLDAECNALLLIKNAAIAANGAAGNTAAKHFVDLYLGGFLGESGSGTNAVFDPDPGNRDPLRGPVAYYNNLEVFRMYMEYCEGGSLDDAYNRAKATANNPNPANVAWPIPEESLWRLFGCLARGLLMMETGSEDPLDPGQAAWATPLGHFDIKPANILIGTHLIDPAPYSPAPLPAPPPPAAPGLPFVGAAPPAPAAAPALEHGRLPVFKFADFGLSLPIPGNPAAPPWMLESEWRASPGFAAPEQVDNAHPNRRIGTETNMWACGAIMHMLMTGEDVQTEQAVGLSRYHEMHRVKNRTTEPYGQAWDRKNYITFSRGLFGSAYSRHLVQLVHRCLAELPADRPKPQALWNIIFPVLATYDRMNITAPPNPWPIKLETPGIPNVPPTGHGKRTQRKLNQPVRRIYLQLPGRAIPANLALPAQPQGNLIFYNLPRRAPQPNADPTKNWYDGWPWRPL